MSIWLIDLLSTHPVLQTHLKEIENIKYQILFLDLGNFSLWTELIGTDLWCLTKGIEMVSDSNVLRKYWYETVEEWVVFGLEMLGFEFCYRIMGFEVWEIGEGIGLLRLNYSEDWWIFSVIYLRTTFQFFFWGLILLTWHHNRDCICSSCRFCIEFWGN